MKYTLIPKTIDAIEYRKGVIIPASIEASDQSIYVHSVSGKVKLVEGDYVIGTEQHKQIVMSAADFEGLYEPMAPKKAVKKAEKATAKKTVSKKAKKK